MGHMIRVCRVSLEHAREGYLVSWGENGSQLGCNVTRNGDVVGQMWTRGVSRLDP